MRQALAYLCVLMGLVSLGCAPQSGSMDSPDVVFVVPGVGGGGPYGGITSAVARPGRSAVVVNWGAPTPLFFLNFSDEAIHNDAERALAERIAQWRRDHPTGRIDLIGHSAGAGVALGALARLQGERVHTVLLLAPSVSPTYDLNPVLAKVDGKIHSFYSDRDTTFLGWRTSTFGTYDRVKVEAAGFSGFLGSYPNSKLVQHGYDPDWAGLGYDGGHFSIRSEAFARRVLAPLLE